MRKQIIFFLSIIFSFTTAKVTAQKIVEGRVYDADTELPIAGVLVFAKNTVKTTKTDVDGTYRIILPERASTLVFSYAGYSKQEVSIKGVTNVEVGIRNFTSRESGNIVVIGSRDLKRTKNDSYTAVDVIPVKSIVSQSGYIELTQILQNFVPSFNANKQSGADLSDHVDPVSMRGLGSDQVLFLVNGKRFMMSPIINIFGTSGRGNVNSDINSIPAASVERIEILRDGAAALYGSDAIAGVVNIVLKTDIINTTGALTFGENITGYGSSLDYKGSKIIPKTTDGQSLNAAITHGFKIGDGTFAITGDYYSRKPTFRPNNDSVFPNINYRQQAGDAQQVAKSLYFNGKFPIDFTEIYTFGGFNNRKTESSIWTIDPADTARNIYQIFPNGYNPHLLSTTNNAFFVLGAKTKLMGWDADFSYSWGRSKVDINTTQTLNPSLYLKSPTAFYNGAYGFEQYIINANMSHKFPNVLKGLNLAFGAEQRFQNYEIYVGEEASWKTYTYKAIPTFGVNDTMKRVGSSQGFPGISPSTALNANRTNLGFYGDAELTISDQLLVAAALRSEIFFDFGQALGGKIALRYKPTPQYSVRFSAQTGFRLPSLEQEYFKSTINDVDDFGSSFERIIFNKDNPLARKLNVQKLSPEKTYNFSFGVSYTPNSKWSFAIDAYNILVNNRIILTGKLGQDDDVIGKDLQDLNVQYAQFYVNALATNTKGLDITTSYKTKMGAGQLYVSLNGNINQMAIPVLIANENFKGKENIIANSREVSLLMNTAPRSKLHANINFRYKKSNFQLNFTRYGSVEISPFDVAGQKVTNKYSPRTITDVSYGLGIHKYFDISIGANNVFDVYPTVQRPDLTETGGQWESVQQGFAGAFFFSKLAFHF